MKKLRLLYMMLIAMLVNQWGFSQTFTVGTCSTGVAASTYGPMNSVATANSKNRTAFIIPASQLAAIGGGTITSTYFKRLTTSGSMTAGNQTFTIYLQNTSATDFGSSTLVWATAISGATQVYNGDPAAATGSTAGMKQFTQSSNFVYNSGSNLAVYVEYTQTAAQATTITWDYEYGSPCISTTNSNTTKYTNTTGTLGDLTSSNYRRPVIGFDVTMPPATTPPACTTITAPANAATAQSTTPTITWTAAAGQPTGYYLNVGTTAGGNDVINNQDVGNVTSYTLPATSTLAYSTTYYVTIVPYNAIGSSTGCTSNSFTTKAIACPTVTAPTSAASGVSTTPTFTWTAVTGATGYKLSVGTTTGGTDILNNVDLGNVTSYTLATTLNSGTKYYYTLNAYSASSTSASCTERTFTTVCNSSIDITSLPSSTWTENFDSMSSVGSGIVPTCWAAVAGTKAWTSMNATSTTYNAPKSTPNYMTIAYGNTTASQLWTPGFTLVAGQSYDFSFYYNTNGTSSSYIGFTGDVQVNSSQSLTGATSIGSFITAAQGTTAYTKYKVSFTPSATGTYYFAVNVSSSSTPWYLGVDDFSLMKTPTCTEPTAVATSAITTSSATVSWTAPATVPAGGYDVYYSTTNTAPTSTTTPSQTGVTGTTATLNGLTSATTYYVWVRSHCSATDQSIWTAGGSFTTACGVVDITLANPYIQNFESATVPALPTCTATINAGTGNVWKTVSNPGNGFTSITLEYPYHSTNAGNTWFFTQGMNLVAGTTYYISYRYGNNSTTFKENLKVAIGTSADATGMTTVINDYPNIQTGVANSVVDVAFTPTTSGVYYLGFQDYSIANQYYLFVDDIKVAMNQTLGTTEVTANKASEKVYPNPFTDFVDISDVKGAVSATVADASGRIVANFAKVDGRLDLAKLNSGMYILSVTKKDGTTSSFKIIKK